MNDDNGINPRKTFFLRMETAIDGDLDFEEGAIDGHGTLDDALEKARGEGAEHKVDVSFIYECRPVRTVSRKFVVADISRKRK